MIAMSKALRPQFQENPLLLVEKRVMHNCTEHGCDQAEWFNASVLRLAEVFQMRPMQSMNSTSSNMTLMKMNMDGQCHYLKT